MADINPVSEITNIIIQNTVNKKIPTLVIISGIDKGELIKNIIWTIKGGSYDEHELTADEWSVVAEIMQKLAEIPLLVKETTDTKEAKSETEIFIKEINKGNGIVIIKTGNITEKDFTIKENISIIFI